jgi:Protein of unknown function (DUF550)
MLADKAMKFTRDKALKFTRDEAVAGFGAEADALRQAIGGNCGAICVAFLWRCTRQGYDYWLERSSGRAPVSDDDRAFMQSLLDALEGPAVKNTPFDLIAHLERQRAFSRETFGPGARTKGVLDHIRKELAEIEADPADISEWVDVIILAFDGAWRAGWEPIEIVAAIVAKQAKNEARTWPDWRTADPEKAIEHDRSGEASQ